MGAVPTESVYVFGSYARGEETPQSDLDLYVVTSDEVERPLEYGKRICLALPWINSWAQGSLLLYAAANDIQAIEALARISVGTHSEVAGYRGLPQFVRRPGIRGVRSGSARRSDGIPARRVALQRGRNASTQGRPSPIPLAESSLRPCASLVNLHPCRF